MRLSKSFNVLLFLTLLACVLSVYQLDRQSLRGDEAFDAVFITRPAASMLDEMRTSQPYPPVYHIALKAWTAIAGRSVFALRFLSAICFVLVVPLTYQLGRLWFGAQAGRFAALLAVFHPLLLWYAQDRMYAPMILLTLGSTVLATRLWQGHGGARLWLGYAALTLLSIGEHYAAIFILIAQNVIALILSLVHRGRHWLGIWFGVQVLIGLAIAPWILFALPVLSTHTSTWAQPVSAFDMLRRLFVAYSVGLTIHPSHAIIPLAGFSLAGVVGLVGRGGRPDRLTRLIALAIIGIPITEVFVVSLSRPMFDERYLVTIISPYLALLGRGLASPRRRTAIGMTGLILAGMLIANLTYRVDPAYAKAPDWNGAFAFLHDYARPTDAIVYTFPDPAPTYYAQDRWPTFLLPSQFPPDPDLTRQRVNEIVMAHPRVWLIPQWSPAWDEHHLVEQILDALAERAAEPSVGRIHLVLYHTPALYVTERTEINATLGERIRLIGAAVRQSDGTATARLVAHPGDTIRVTLYWQASQRPETEYSVFVHLLNSAGQIQSQRDGWPRDGAYPTSWWEPGATVVDTRVLPIPPNTPPGHYTLVTGMYDAAGTRLPIAGPYADAANSRVILPVTVEIQPP